MTFLNLYTLHLNPFYTVLNTFYSYIITFNINVLPVKDLTFYTLFH